MGQTRDPRLHHPQVRSPASPHQSSPWLNRATRAPESSRTGRLACPHCGASSAIETDYCALDGTRLVRSEHDPLIGRIIDHYLVFEHIGDGGLGRVYRAGNIFLEQAVALKVLWGNLAADRSATERFRLEARAASMIRHENIVEVLDFGVTAEGLVFMVMELLEGKTLAQELRDAAPFSPHRVRALIRQLALGLEAAHVRGLVHRDLKPANVMLVDRPEGERAKILDFGLVAFQGTSDEDPTRLTRPGEVFGTPAYMAPEQIMGGDTDPRTDLYALGAILYQMIAGHPPFEGTVREVLTQQLGAQPRPLHGVGPLGKLAMHLLEKLPEHRPQSARELVELLDRVALHPAPAQTQHTAGFTNTFVRGSYDPAPVSRVPSLPPRLSVAPQQTMPPRSGLEHHVPRVPARHGHSLPPPLFGREPSFGPVMDDDDDDDLIARAGLGRRKSRAWPWVAVAAGLAIAAVGWVERDRWVDGPAGAWLARAGIDLRSTPDAPPPAQVRDEYAGLPAAQPDVAIEEDVEGLRPSQPAPAAAPPPIAPPAPVAPAPQVPELAEAEELREAEAPADRAEPPPPAKRPRRKARTPQPDYDAMMDRALRDAERAAQEDLRRNPPPAPVEDDEFETDPLFQLEE